jgi:hypothetical protein
MGAFSIWHLAIVAALIAIYAIPVAKILRRAGFSGWWTIGLFFPLIVPRQRS